MRCSRPGPSILPCSENPDCTSVFKLTRRSSHNGPSPPRLPRTHFRPTVEWATICSECASCERRFYAFRARRPFERRSLRVVEAPYPKHQVNIGEQIRGHFRNYDWSAEWLCGKDSKCCQ